MQLRPLNFVRIELQPKKMRRKRTPADCKRGQGRTRQRKTSRPGSFFIFFSSSVKFRAFFFNLHHLAIWIIVIEFQGVLCLERTWYDFYIHGKECLSRRLVFTRHPIRLVMYLVIWVSSMRIISGISALPLTSLQKRSQKKLWHSISLDEKGPFTAVKTERCQRRANKKIS